MICPNCKTANDDQYVYCVNCGAGMTARTVQMAEIIPPTVLNARPPAPSNYPENSVMTVFPNHPTPHPLDALYQPPPARKGGAVKFVVAGVAAVLLLGLLGVGGFVLFAWQKASAEALPDHLGMFFQSPDRAHVDELKKIDLVNAVDGKDNLLKDDALPVLNSDPTMILYSDGKDVPVSDLRLIPLDTIKGDGTFKQIDFQASPVESKPEMKRLKIPGGLAGGKYAFALIDGFLNEGKHKFWAFQVRDSARPTNDGSSLHAASVAVKPTPTPTPAVKSPTPTPAIPPPSGGTVAYTTTGNLVLRTGPSQDAAKLRNLRRGEKVYILRYSQNTEIFDGIESQFAYIQTENGQTGWVFVAFLK
ncbi:MAG: SH3 domain-containing protein [Pyrinomonadaceae bacterium]